ncbi:tripartite tricarboxylate transporter permease [Notoacmeibacter sp. MSK16QG-6]|uniref:tripartite tricarboxylate transporter permease n=1 Tax=Notoacmeibacter sp. MSK16QG-6 TaxID=2957982 RepID=UPI00209D8C8D|nr:tripartite tricarboxylate transporter permease [Notoacmeibacter sp. MSK16QG-6]MCP1199571.1 tripartite tricarboxylate transporter permease [Notoacmeibacter sp. MSK16QG-6]
MFDMFLTNIVWLMTPSVLLFMLFAVLFGLVLGALPGMSATMAIAIVLPLTFTLETKFGIALLIGVYIGGVTGGLVSATLLRIPGTPSSIATTFDAYPLAQKGFAQKALGTAMVASAVGGMISLMVLVAFAPTISAFAVKLGPHEYAMLSLGAIILVVFLSSGNFIKGLIAAILGMTIASVGFAPIDGTARLSFGIIDIMAGVSLVPLMVGLFGASQVISGILSPSVASGAKLKVTGQGITLREFRDNIKNMLRSSAIGVGIGILPGIGGSASNLLAYGAAKQSAKDPEAFGTGDVRGIYASESANNASVGGALLPLITLGIPGDGATAILIGGFTIHGLQPGPLLFQEQPDLMSMIYAAFAIATLVLLVIQLGTIRLFPKVLLTPPQILNPLLLMLMVVGTYVSDNRVFDVWLMLGFAILGYLLERFGFSLAPLILGFILGPIFETNFRRAMMFSEGNMMDFVTRPISATFLGFVVLLLFLSLGGLRLLRRSRA